LQPHVVILLATYNGGRFLDEQLESLARQSVERVDIRVSDDGSTDGTLRLLDGWAARWTKGHFVIDAGPKGGFSENFRALALSRLGAFDYVAFCDQDDIWEPDKLAAAIAALDANSADRPAVYFSRTSLVDSDGTPIGYSHLFMRPPSFGNALTQSIGGGNTMVFNRKGFAIYAESARRSPFLFHDWWGYLIVSGAGGYVHYDTTPRIRYRQHTANQLGSDMSPKARLRRLGKLFQGGLRDWNDRNLQSLEASADLLSPEAMALTGEFRAIRGSRGPAALIRLGRSRIRRQTFLGNLSLAIAAALGRL